MMPWPRRMSRVRWLAAARKTSGALRVGVLLQEVVLDLPDHVEAETVGQLHLLQGVVDEPELAALVPGARELVFVEEAELHEAATASSVFGVCQRRRRSRRPPARRRILHLPRATTGPVPESGGIPSSREPGRTASSTGLRTALLWAPWSAVDRMLAFRRGQVDVRLPR